MMNIRTRVLRLLLGTAVLVLVFEFSSWFIRLTGLHFPPPLLGVMVLCLLLKTKICPPALVQDICELLLKHMTLFFIPLTVGIMVYGRAISQNLTPILAAVFLGTFISMILTALLIENTIKLIKWRRLKRSK
ncbi:MAG TPA: hypothetical protein DCP52_04870 [Elusimicrobia bacterium]|nr:hypothetical protein [Elusimicrobiota bacterium]